MSLSQQNNFLYYPHAIISWNPRKLKYLTISYYGNTTATSNTITSDKLIGSSYISPDISLNTLYTFTLTPYNSAGSKGISKKIILNTSCVINNAYIVSSSGKDVTFQWSGTYYYVKFHGKKITDTDYTDLSVNVMSSPYSYTGLEGNTNYTFYITTYDKTDIPLSISDNLTTKTLVQSASNITNTILDNSSIGVSFSYPTNENITTDYTLQVQDSNNYDIFDVSGLTSPLQLFDLSGNTKYITTIITTLNNDEELYAVSDGINNLTKVQPPINLNTLFYDNSSIITNFYNGKNTYNSVYYTVLAIDNSNNKILTVSGETTSINLLDLSGNTTYTISVKNTLDENLALTATSLTSTTTTTKIQPITDFSAVFTDSSSIGFSYNKLKNTYITRKIISNILDVCDNILITINDTSTNAISTYTITDLIGNTQYYFSFTTILNDNMDLSAAANLYTTRTYIQPAQNITISFYDSSSVDVSFNISKNNYRSLTDIYYKLFITDNINIKDTSSNNNNLIIQDLSSSTTYNYYIKTYISSKSEEFSFKTEFKPFIQDIFATINFT